MASVSERPVATSPAMSMSLYVWSAPVITDADEAARLLNLEDESVFEPSDRLRRFFDELLERYPSPDVPTDRELEDGVTPWADGPEGSERLVSLSVRWGARDEDVDEIVALARKHELVIYDPQGPGFHTSAEDEAVTYRPGTGEFLRGLALALFGVLLSAIAWKLSVPVLTWVLVFVGGFVAVVAVVSLLATAHARFGARATP
jgi:hypothetical protein